MKKLNKKGFTLVELLAVIVILAVIMVITIPTVLGSMADATDSAFDSAKKAVQKYIDDQIELCNAGLGELAGYEKDLFVKQGKTCRPSYAKAAGPDNSLSDAEKEAFFEEIVDKAGYDGQMTIEFDVLDDICVSGEAAKDAGGNYTQTPCNYNETNDGHQETGFGTTIKNVSGQGEFAGR